MLSERDFKICCKKYVEKLINQKTDKSIWIYGAGKGGAILKEVFDEHKVEVCGFVDKKANELNCIEELPVVTLNKLNPKEDFLVISLRAVDEEIIYECSKKGFESKDIYYVAAGREMNKEDIVYRGCKIGRYTYGYEGLLEYYPIVQSIGRFCSINTTAKIWNNHPTECISTHPFLDHPYFNTWEKQIERETLIKKYGIHQENHSYAKSELRKNKVVTIGNDVWIGANVVILPGVHIGNGAIIGAGAIITKDIPDYGIALGVPAKVEKYRFDKQTIQKLLEIKWWDWSLEKIEENIELFYNPEMLFNKEL